PTIWTETAPTAVGPPARRRGKGGTAMFSKRHYEAIALAMQEAKPLPSWCANKHAQWTVTVAHLANMFGRDNGRFNRERFEAACEPGANVKLRTRYAARLAYKIAAE